jgi:hypothetical protein
MSLYPLAVIAISFGELTFLVLVATVIWILVRRRKAVESWRSRVLPLKAIPRALFCSTALEIILIVPLLLIHTRLGIFDVAFTILAYLAGFCHWPAMALLCYWPAAHKTWIMFCLVQWCIWFFVFMVIFLLRRLFRRLKLGHETRGT